MGQYWNSSGSEKGECNGSPGMDWGDLENWDKEARGSQDGGFQRRGMISSSSYKDIIFTIAGLISVSFGVFVFSPLHKYHARMQMNLHDMQTNSR